MGEDAKTNDEKTNDEKAKDQEPKHDKVGAMITAKEVAQTAAGIGGAVGGALLHPAAPGAAVLAAALLALFPPLLGIMTEAAARRMRARGDRFLETIVETWARDEGKTHEEVAAVLQERREDPHVSDAIWRAVRGLMDAPNDAAAVPLGVLAAEYSRDSRPADAFFRGTVRLLSEIDEGEIAELRALLAWVLNSTRRPIVTVLASDTAQEGDPASVVEGGAYRSRARYERVPWYVKLRRDDSAQPEEPDYGNDAWLLCACPPNDAGRMFALLKANSLGDEPTMGVMGAATLLELERASTERLYRILRVSQVS